MDRCTEHTDAIDTIVITYVNISYGTHAARMVRLNYIRLMHVYAIKILRRLPKKDGIRKGFRQKLPC